MQLAAILYIPFTFVLAWTFWHAQWPFPRVTWRLLIRPRVYSRFLGTHPRTRTRPFNPKILSKSIYYPGSKKHHLTNPSLSRSAYTCFKNLLPTRIQNQSTRAHRVIESAQRSKYTVNRHVSHIILFFPVPGRPLYITMNLLHSYVQNPSRNKT